MKRTTQKFLFLLSFFVLVTNTIVAQNAVPFTAKYNASLKGDMLLIGNGILNRKTTTDNPNVAYNGTDLNDNLDMQYIDIDGDTSTFSSSSANLTIPTLGAGNCYKIAYAALYWGGVYSKANVDAAGTASGDVVKANFNKVKFKLPGGTYTDITGTILYDSPYVATDATNATYSYAGFANVTSLLQGLPDANGTYTVANLIAGKGKRSSGGWSLFIVYEDPLATAKNITSFDGFSGVKGGQSLNIPISGFTTIPFGPVRAKVAFSALEGDFGITGDRLQINSVDMSTGTRGTNNFFNSSINDINGSFLNRLPASKNLLGFDAGIFEVLPASIIPNNATSATVTLVTDGDQYFYYFNAFAVEIIQPQINLIKTVTDLTNINIGNGNVNLGQQLYYDLEFQNIGNDNATFFTITDILPVNVNFLPADLILPPGVTHVFDAATNKVTFTIPNALVTTGGAKYKIRIKVKVVETCDKLRDACSNEIKNQAFKTYSSQTNNNIVENEQPSASSISGCLIPEPGTTNFLVGIDGCIYAREEVLCGANVTLTAGANYTSYQWHNGSPATAANAIPGATSQSYTTTVAGVYSVVNTAPAPCLTITETITVINFDALVPNPLIGAGDVDAICTNDGSILPKIFLCGAGDTRLIQTNILNATSIIWEKLNEASCAASTIVDCPNTNSSCVWSQVGTGPNFTANVAGQYRVKIVFQNGCFRTYHFNVFQNLFTPTEVHKDIICGKNGSITVNGVPPGYEYSLNAAGPWVTTNVFSIPTANNYTVYIRQIGTGVGNCVFELPNISIRERNFTVDVIPTQPLCNDSKGSIRVQINDAEPQYTYQLFLGATLVASAGPINSNDHIFSGLNPGAYTIIASTADGCTSTQNAAIIAPDAITVTANVTIPLTCSPGEITIYPVGGTGPYIYQLNPPAFQSTPNFEITAPGTYNITVTDFNNCVATTTIVVNEIPMPEFTVTQTNSACYGSDSGSILFNVTNNNGYTLSYSIDNGTTFTANPSFTGLPAGTYQTVVQYVLGSTICTTVAQAITITEPATALTASGGVSQLAGCGPSGEGEVRITNPQGGVQAYEYSFDNGITYGTANTKFLPAGTYTLYIRDANLCVYPMNITIDPIPTPPTIVVNNPDFNCDGTATSTITVNDNGGSFEYTYLLDGVPNTNVPNNVFLDVPCGDHTIKVQYKNLNIPTFSNLLNEDFGQGIHTTSPGINPAYCFERQVAATQCNGSTQINDGDYAVLNRIDPRFGTWADAKDHTSNGTNPNGRFLCVNIGGVAGVGGILYSKPIVDIIPNQDVQVSVWAMNLLMSGTTGFNPNLTIQLVKDLGLPTQVIIASQETGDIPKISNWQNYTLALNPGNNTNLNFVIRSNITETQGNDVVIDDINVYQIPKSCITEVDFPVTIACNQAFSASITGHTDVACNGGADGKLTIAVQNFALPYGFDYSIDGGTNWVNSTTSPVIVTSLGANSYNVLVRYDNTATTCSFPFTQVIAEPTPLVVNASLTTPATCLVGGTITAVVTGGTANYQYQLLDNLGNIVRPFQNSAVFTNVVAGDYVVIVKDANGCSNPIGVSINVPAAVTPTATISLTSDLCYDTVNAATIVVDAINGVLPYKFSINGGVFQNSNTFSGLLPGSYTVTVRDAYGCEVTLAAVTISPQLTANILIANNLNCGASPDATLSGTISGGLAPYTYQVSFNGGALSTPVTNVIGTTYNYNATVTGNYQFTITDASGCTFVSNTIVVKPLPVLPAPTVVQTNAILCHGDSNAAIAVNASGGLSPYVINVLNTTTGFNYGTQTSGLEAGVYVITVTDANSCTASTSITITEPASINYTTIKTDILCSGGVTAPGAIEVVNVVGGTAPFNYYVTNSFGYYDTFTSATGQDHSFIILNFGIYDVTVVDANGCQMAINGIIISSPPDSLTIDLTTATVDCTIGGTVQVTVNSPIAGGPYHFAIYQDLTPANPPYPEYITNPGLYVDADVPGGLTATFIGLLPGVTYSFIVYDETTKCHYFETASGPVPTPSSVTSTVTPNNVTCTGFADGSVSFTFEGYSGTSVSYQIFTALNNVPVGPIGVSNGLTGGPTTVSNFGALPPGVYYVLFTEVDGTYIGCSQASANFSIFQSAVGLELNASVVKNDNCGINAGQINAIGSFGTAPYQYQLVTAGGTPPTATTWAGQTSPLFNAEGGSYDVYVKDRNNCIKTVTINLPTDSSPQIAISQDATTTCNANEGSYSITVFRDNTVGIAPFTYSVDGSAFNSYTEDALFSFVISGLNSGTHTIVIKDANGCLDTKNIIINAPIVGNAVASIAAATDCGASDGIITVNAVGGSGSYSYSILPNPAGITLTANVFTNIPSGNYQVTITDLTSLCTSVVTVDLATPAPVLFTSTVTDVTCYAGSDGSIEVILDPASTDPVYTYQITGPVTVGPQTSNVFNGLPTGTYSVTVLSARGCSLSQAVVVNQPAEILVPVLSIAVSQFDCNSGTNATNFATITVTGVTGGSSTYINYEFVLGGTIVQSGTSNVYTESNLLGGAYTVNVYDNNGCMGTTATAVIITPFVSIATPSVTVTSAITCTTDEAITINVVSTGGIPANLTYTVVGLASNPYNVTQSNNPNFTGLTVGNYEITVLNVDTGCSVKTIHYVFSPNTFNVNVTVSNNVTCFGASEGSIVVNFIDNDLTSTNDAGPFTYVVTNQLGNQVANGTTTSAGPEIINGLASGIYQLQATLVNTPFCTVTTNFTITQPAAVLEIFANSTPITCVATSDDGTISVSALNGWGAPYEFQLELGATVVSAWSTSSYFTGLTPGTYTASVRDALGCPLSTTITLNVPTPINASASATATSLLCFNDNNGEIIVTGVTGGSGSGYLYSLLNVTTGLTSAPQTSNVFANLGAGTYQVIVSDSFTCEFISAPIVITQPADLVQAQLATATTATCEIDATITLSASGGTAPYRYSTTTGGPYTAFTGSVTFNAPAGIYKYFVVDANNCTEAESTEITVSPVVPVSVTVNTANAIIYCNGGTATVTATATDGLGGYTYTLNPATAGVTENNGVFENVPAGTYTIDVTSGDCSGASVPFVINQPEPIVATVSSTNVTCNGLDNGIIEVIATGGTGIIQYSISSNPLETVNSGLFTNLAAGTYTISVQDQAGCFLAPITVTITQPEPISFVSFGPVQEEVCYVDGGSISFSLTGGTVTATVGYTVVVNGGAYTQTSLTGDFNFTNLPAGLYNFIVKDANGCADLQFEEILNPGVDIQGIVDVDYLCTGNSPTNIVTVFVNPDVPLSEFTFSLDGAAPVSSNVFYGVGPAGNHQIVINHISGCIETLPFTVVAYSSPELTLAQTGLNQFTAITVGGAGDNQYTLNGQDVGTTTVYMINQTGNYTVTVTDANGCTDTKVIFMKFYDVTIPNFFTPDGDGNNDGWSPIYTDNFPNLVVYIFDRYSRKVASLKQGDSWDGTYNNKPLPTGDYWYVIKLNGDSDTREFIGNFTLYR
ncbi:T9SS type B sorting domain-containing protein [Flavobacterium ardleyense]|uniref:T9SS type B sorting domain-containing protein n=1 Tax=Flavobacterium ardleyense TaxID=2038737 RepID=A0ABW5Z746_9FLAO